MASTALDACLPVSLTVLMQATEGAENGQKRSDFQNTLLLAIPTLFDLTATILMSVGLLYVTASVYQASILSCSHLPKSESLTTYQVSADTLLWHGSLVCVCRC